MMVNLNLQAGERVRVKSKQEILATLDEQGTVEKLPFMPEMLQYCGREFVVYKRAEKTCDTIGKTGARRVMHAVHLEDVRCDGSAHDGCGARCLMYWKEDWLERPSSSVPSSAVDSPEVSHPTGSSAPLTEAQLLVTTTRPSEESSKGGEVYRCQITDLLNFSTPLSSWDIHQYIRDLQCGNVGLGSMFSAFMFRFYQCLMRLPGLRVWYWIYDTFQKFCGGVPFPYRTGRLEGKTPSDKLNLQPGELVQVKSHENFRYLRQG